MLFAHLPVWAQVLFTVTLMIILVVQVHVVVLYVLAAHRFDRVEGDESDFLWVFVVPALDEERTIADSVGRLMQVECTNKLVLVVDDGSSDATGTILDDLAVAHDHLEVLHRHPPSARTGKSAALNAAYDHLLELLDSDALGVWEPGRVIVGVVDADGRLDAGAPSTIAHALADPEVAGVQVKVRIYNDDTILTWCQDVEFSIYGSLYQAARSRLHVAGMGGNGQFNRLAALVDVDDGNGPWQHTLTEDQDIGLRFITHGWHTAHVNTVCVHQQGVPHLRRLLRQRTRWAQGNLQAVAHLPSVLRSRLGWFTTFDQVMALAMPAIQALVGISFAASVYLAVAHRFRLLPDTWWLVLVFYTVGFGSMVLGCSTRYGRSPSAILKGLLLANVYVPYTWTIWPVLARASYRHLRHRTGWDKTEREVVSEPT